MPKLTGKSPDVLMMQSTEDGSELDASDCVHRAPNWRIFRQRQVRSSSVVVIHVGQQQMPQVPRAEHHDMVETFPTDRADQTLRIAVLPGRMW